jgi:putative ABC transport system permease protein
MLRIALKMLFGDKMKFMTLVVGLTFTCFLLTQQGSIFCGLMLSTASNIFETGAPIWVVDSTATSFNDVVDLKLREVARVRSVSGVKWAVPLSLHDSTAQSDEGKTTAVQVVGVDDESLIGLPAGLKDAHYEDLNQPNAVIIAKSRSERYGSPLLGDEFEINDHRVKVVGLLDSKESFSPFPIVYTAISRVQSLMPDKQRIVSFILVKPKAGVDATELCQKINEETGLKAIQLWDFVFSTMEFWAANTGIPINFGTNVLMVLIIGTVISAQTLYAFMLENIRQFGTFKAIGITNGELARMVFVQSITVGLIGYGLGVGMASLFGLLLPDAGPLAYYTPPPLIWIVLFLVMGFCVIASFLSLYRVLRIDPAIVFRG